jgi:pSer/pThr/pTyr-binding forkhead associated (FHA) protein
MSTLRLVPSSGLPSSISTIEITAAETMVGREPGCDVLLSDGSVSRKHAKIERRGQVWAVVDQGSANGTYVDSQKIGEALLKNGQELRFGTVAFRVELPAEDMDVTVAGNAPEATILATPAPPKPPPPPPVPKASPPPIPPGAPLPAPPGPPSAAAAKERFRGAGAPASAPVPQMSAPPPPRKGRGPFFWMVAGCCGCLLLVLLLAGALTGGLYVFTQGAAEGARATLRQIKRGDVDGAYAGLAPSLKAEMSREEFEALIERHPALKNNADATFWSRSVTNDRATLSGVLTPDGGGPPERVTIELHRDGGVWKISRMKFDDARESRGGTRARLRAA